MGNIFCSWLIILALCYGSISLHPIRAEAAGLTADPALQLGIDRYHSGDNQEALSLLRGFAIRNFDSPDLPLAYLYLARIFQKQGSHQEALLYTGRIPAEQKGAEALLIEGISQIATGQIQAGLTTLLSVDPTQLSDVDRSNRIAALARAHSELGQNLEALTFIHRNPQSGDRALSELAREILQTKLTPVELAEAAFMFRGTAIGQEAVLQQVKQAFARQDQAEAQRLLAQLPQEAVTAALQQESLVQKDQPFASSATPRAIGVILPLSGKYATFGQLVRRGIELAVEKHNQNRSAIRLTIRDSGDSSEESARIVAELAADPEVLAIAGPLTGGAAAAAAEAAQRLRIPLFTLSPRNGLPETGPYVFRDSLTSRQQTQALVSYAMESLGLSTFGILHPENKLGYEMTDLFIREVQTRGGHVIATQMYNEKATDFRRQVKLLLGQDPNAPDLEPTKADRDEVMEDDEAQQKTPPPFQALFIPDYADKISMIAPQLLFYGLENAQLLGINGWNSPDLLRTTGRYLEGAVFVDGFYRASADPAVQQFVESYTSRYGEEPSILEAQGFDVASILLQRLDRPEVRSRDDLRNDLAQLKNYAGASGNTSIAVSGDAQKTLFLLKIEQGVLVEIH